MNLESYFVDIIKGKRTGPFASFVKFILGLLSKVFGSVVKMRNWAFDKGWFRRYHPPVPMVISIGNIVAGGTGKTPVTLMVAQEFSKEFQIAVLSRGYRSSAEKLPVPTILSRGQGPMHPASYCGDEPFLIAKNLPDAIVIVGRDRHQASNLAAKEGAQLILLDDGMQHRHLARDLEIIVMDISDPFGQGHFLPRGLLREDVHSLSRANLVILNHVQHDQQFLAIKQQIAKYTSAPVVGTRMSVDAICDRAGTPLKLERGDSLNGTKVGIFCGIAQPENFEKTVRGEGATIIGHHFVPDHMSCDWDVLEQFSQKCRDEGAELLLCTEKDWVKIPSNLQLSLPIAWLKMKLDIVAGDSEWRSFVQTAKEDLSRQV